MDFESERYNNNNNNKRIYQRLGPKSNPSDRSSKVCFHWQSGRCNRHPCPFLHADPPVSGSGGDAMSAKRTQYGNPNSRPGGLVWRNPYNGGNGNGNGNGSNLHSKWGKGVRQKIEKICNHFVAGSCSYGDRCKYLHSWFVGDSFSLLTPLQGHEKVITGIALPDGSNKLFSGSKDGSVRVWDCQTGQCVQVITMGGEVGCMINEGPWIFIGVTNAVKAWNTQTSAQLSLDGPTGQVYALVGVNEMLFAGVQDGQILAWKYNMVGNCFEPAASLTGHRLAVVSIVVGGSRLYSGSMDHTIRVWDLTTLQCIQTLTDHSSVVMSVLCWDQFLISCSLDKTIKIWATAESGNLEVTYTHNEEHGVLTLCGMPDAQLKPVLFSACNDNSVRLYDLPSFNDRGKIFTKEEVRAIQVGPGGLFFTGDGTGELKVWKWKEPTSS